MRAVVSVVLAMALVTTPLKMVLAQAAQQEAVSVQQTVPPDSSGHRLIGVPPVTDNPSRLWRPALENHSVQSWPPEGVKVVLKVILTAALLVGLYFLVKGLNNRGEPIGR